MSARVGNCTNFAGAASEIWDATASKAENDINMRMAIYVYRWHQARPVYCRRECAHVPVIVLTVRCLYCNANAFTSFAHCRFSCFFCVGKNLQLGVCQKSSSRGSTEFTVDKAFSASPLRAPIALTPPESPLRAPSPGPLTTSVTPIPQLPLPGHEVIAGGRGGARPNHRGSVCAARSRASGCKVTELSCRRPCAASVGRDIACRSAETGSSSSDLLSCSSSSASNQQNLIWRTWRLNLLTKCRGLQKVPRRLTSSEGPTSPRPRSSGKQGQIAPM